MTKKQARKLVTLIDDLIAAKIGDAITALEDPMSCASTAREQKEIRASITALLVGSAS